MAFIDEIAPAYIGANNISLSLLDPDAAPRAFFPIDVLVDYSQCAPGGVIPPLEFTVMPPNKANFFRYIFHQFSPNTLSYTPREGGEHLFRLAELGHNHWVGTFVVDVSGDPILQSNA